jgi:putative membrane protein
MIAYFLLFDPFGYAISPVSLVSVSLAAWIYMRGVARSTRLRGTVSIWRQALFFAGLTCILAATNAPLASLGHSLFSAHQVEHLLLRLAGPLLIAVTQPWRLLQAGLNRRWRRYLGALGKSITLRFLAHPVTATAALITSLFIWQIPVLYGLAQRIAAIEVFAHFAMVLAGIWYFGMLFDPRDPPEGARRGARLISGFAVIVSNIFLGSLTTLKEVSLYASYQTAGTGLLDPLSDETMGGYTIWVPSSMVSASAIPSCRSEAIRASPVVEMRHRTGRQNGRLFRRPNGWLRWQDRGFRRAVGPAHAERGRTGADRGGEPGSRSEGDRYRSAA